MKVLYLVWSMVLVQALGQRNERPIIGVLTKPMIEEYPDIKTPYTEVIEAKYVHFIEGGGGRVFPLSYKLTKEQFRERMEKLNGILFTGGATELLIYENEVPVALSEYSKGLKSVLEIATEMNANGVYFPVWGTCLGFEVLLVLESNNLNLLSHCYNCSHYHAVLNYTAESSRLYSSFSAYYRNYMASVNITYNNHVWAVDNKTFFESADLVQKYKITSYSPWLNESTLYISAVEHKKYPFYGVQFHPEKWNYEVIAEQKVIKTEDSIRLGHGFSNFLVDEAKKNDHHFQDYKEELKVIVEREFTYYHPVYGYLYFLAKSVSE